MPRKRHATWIKGGNVETHYHYDAERFIIDETLTKLCNDLSKQIDDLKTKVSQLQNQNEEQDEENKKRVQEIGRLARLCCSSINDSRGSQQQQISEETDFRSDELSIPTVHLATRVSSWTIQNYNKYFKVPFTTITVSKRFLDLEEDSVDEPLDPENPSGDVESDSDDLRDSDSLVGPDDDSGELETGQEPDKPKYTLEDQVRSFFPEFAKFDYNLLTKSRVLFVRNHVTTVQLIVWGKHQGTFGDFREIVEAECKEFEEIEQHISADNHYGYEPEEEALFYNGTLWPKTQFEDRNAMFLFQGLMHLADYLPDLKYVNIGTKRHADVIREETIKIDARDPGYYINMVLTYGAYHAIWELALADKLGYIDIPDFLKDNKLTVGATVMLGCSSSGTQVVSGDDYASVIKPLPNPGSLSIPSKADFPSSANTLVFDKNGELIWESDGKYDISGVLLETGMTLDEIGSIHNAGSDGVFVPVYTGKQ